MHDACVVAQNMNSTKLFIREIGKCLNSMTIGHIASHCSTRNTCIVQQIACGIECALFNIGNHYVHALCAKALGHC